MSARSTRGSRKKIDPRSVRPLRLRPIRQDLRWDEDVADNDIMQGLVVALLMAMVLFFALGYTR